MMAVVKERYLSHGSNMGFVRQYCGPCKSETLHRSQLCIHCGSMAGVRQSARSKWQYKDGLQIRRRRS